MVRVKVLIQQDQITDVEITGHADSGPHGQDLVCAGVSSIGVGALNALDELVPGSCLLEMDAGYIHIQVNDSTPQVQLLLKNLLIQYRTMETSYSKFIKIQQEVSS